MKSYTKKNPVKKNRPAAADNAGEFLRAWLLAGLVALCVARPLLPSEGVSWLGDGQPFNMLWLVAAGAYLLWALRRGGLARPLNLVDAGVAGLVVVCAASAVVGSHNRADEIELGLTATGSPRLAINMLWEWVALGLAFFLTRQLVRTAREARALVAVMMALAVVLAGYGYYQVFVGLPADRAEYAENPDQVLPRLNQWIPPNSPERQLFESRLQSTEPFATFALTNSLAGFLAPWLVVALGIGWSLVQNSRGGIGSVESVARRWSALGIARGLALAACFVAVVGCFVLTKSRSGYLALLVGAGLVPFASSQGGRMFPWKLALAAAAVLSIVVGGAVAIHGLDAAVITEAGKSLGYRLQYWQSTLAMIGNYPWLGVGPGNFQNYYTQFKLPQASEEIRDPHNFVLEVWATAGTLALLALCEILGVFAWRTCHTPAVSWGPAAEGSPAETTRNAKFIAAGAAAAFGVAFLIGPTVGLAFSEERLISGLAVGAVVVALLWPWVARGTLPPRLPALGVLVLAIHLLASGGITIPGVAGTFWMLLALGLNQMEGEPSVNKPGPRAWASRLGLIGAVAVTCSAAVACFISAYRPVLLCRAAMAKADEPDQDARTRLMAYRDAAKGDPLSGEPWSAIAEMELARLKEDPGSARSFENFADATRRIGELQPHSSSAWRQTGRWYAELYEQNHDPELAATAVECFRNAVELYPNLATLRGEYALALQAADQSSTARRHAEKALQLDQQTSHADKKLSPQLAERLQALLAGSR